MILGLAWVTIATWADTGQVGATADLRAMDGSKVDVDPAKLGNRGENPRDLLWKYAEVMVEWGFKKGTENIAFDGSIESTHLLGRVGKVSPLPGDKVTRVTGDHSWTSPSSRGARRGIVVPVLYADAVRGPGRTILTVRTGAGSFSFQPVDLNDGPILVPEHGFFVADASTDVTAKAFEAELASRNLKTIRQMVREHSEQTWEGAMRALHGDVELPPYPEPPYLPHMSVDVPDDNLDALWRIGAWQIIKNCPRIRREDVHEVGRRGDVGDLPRVAADDPNGMYVVRCNPFPPLGCETERILLCLDQIGMHEVAEDGISVWLENQQPDGALHLNSKIELAHLKGAVQLPWVLVEHAMLTGDVEWLKKETPKLKAAFDWIINRRRATMNKDLSQEDIDRIAAGTWSPYGTQPPLSIGDGNPTGSRYYYEADGYAYRSVKLLADAVATVDPQLGAEMANEVEAYRKDLLPAVLQSILQSPVIKVKDGAYRQYLPQGFQDHGLLSRALPEGVNVYTHCGPYHSDYKITSGAVDAWLRSGLFTLDDTWVDGHFDVVEDVLLLNHPWYQKRKPDYDPERDWFGVAGWGYQTGWERIPDYYLVKDDVPNFLRAWLNRFAADINLKNWTFNEHTTMAENDKSHGNSVFLTNFRNMLVMEIGDSLWLGRGTPRAWLEDGKTISVKNAPTHFGEIGYEFASAAGRSQITATIDMPSRKAPESVMVRFRHPQSRQIKSVTVNGNPWSDFDRGREAIALKGLTGTVTVVARY